MRGASKRVGRKNQHEVEREALPFHFSQIGDAGGDVAAEHVDRHLVTERKPERVGELLLCGVERRLRFGEPGLGVLAQGLLGVLEVLADARERRFVHRGGVAALALMLAAVGCGDAPAPAKKAEAPKPAPAKAADGSRVFASPLARRLAKEKGIDPDVVITAIEEAVATASRKYYRTNENLKTRFNTETGQVDLFALKTVVEDVGPSTTVRSSMAYSGGSVAVPRGATCRPNMATGTPFIAGSGDGVKPGSGRPSP
mgnify:CR=1 FL=1